MLHCKRLFCRSVLYVFSTHSLVVVQFDLCLTIVCL